MERRWILFFASSVLVIMVFQFIMQKNMPPPARNTAATAGTATSNTLVATSSPTSGSVDSAITNGNTSDSVATAPARPRTLESTSITIAAHPGPLTTSTINHNEIGFDSIGGVVYSWKLITTGTEETAHSRAIAGGVQLVRHIPGHADEAAPEQIWPLEVTFREQNANDFEDLNKVPWSVKATPAGDLVMQSPTVRGLHVQKIFTPPNDHYYSTLKVTLSNETNDRIQIYGENERGLTLRWGPGLVEHTHDDTSRGESAYDSAVARFDGQIKSFSPRAGVDPLEAEGHIEWAGVESKFFTALLVPPQPDDAAHQNHYFFRTLVPSWYKSNAENGPPITAEISTDRFDLAPKSTRTFEFGIYAGPKKYQILSQGGHHLETIMFHTAWPFMRVIYLFLTDVLNWIYGFAKNYGIAIILLTVLIRLVTFPLTQKSIKLQAKSAAEMQRIKPYIDEINEKYKNKPEEKQAAMLKVYREHNVNPFGVFRSCLPLFIQWPILAGLYRVSNDTIDLKGATFLWIQDLSQPDKLFPLGFSMPLFGWTHLNLLPILMGLTQIIATRIASARVQIQDPTQKQVMYMMPIMLTVMLFNLPAGLMLYWIASNIWQIGQTMVVNRQMRHTDDDAIKQGRAVAFKPGAHAQKSASKSK